MSALPGAGALDGLRVIDLSSVVMGPYATQILGDLGADVIKVEPPSGDMSRRTHPQRNPGMGALALNVNRNKRSVVLDLKSEDGRQAFLDLAATADLLVTNMRPGALDRLGLSYEALAQRYPRLIYVQAQGFRSDSQLADRAAYDEIVQAASGMADLMRRATGTPTYAPTIMADKVCALTIVYAALAAVIHQRSTGQGQHVEVPMTDTLLAFNLVEHMAGHTYVPPSGPMGFNRSMAEGHEAVATADGWACILPYNSKNVADFFTALDRPDLAADARFADPAALSRHQSDLYRLVAELALERTTEQWAQLCAAHSIPFAPVLDLDHVEDDPYVAEGDLLATAEHPSEGTYRSIAFPVRLSATPGGMRTPCPSLGQDTAQVLAELGRTPEQVQALLAAVEADPGASVPVREATGSAIG